MCGIVPAFLYLSFECHLFYFLLIFSHLLNSETFSCPVFSLVGLKRGDEVGLFHVKIYRKYLVLGSLTVCDNQKLQFVNSNNNTAIISYQC